MSLRIRAVAVAVAAVGMTATACATSGPGNGGGTATGSGGERVITAAASIDAWGSVLTQLGGDHVRTTSIISNPDTDPHDYEPTPKDGRTIAEASLFVENGIGYDSWADKALAANPSDHRAVIDVGRLTGTPDDGNPHQWYSPSAVQKVADAITAALTKADPDNASYFADRRRTFDTTALAGYDKEIAAIRAKYSGVQVGASESLFAPLSDALGLDLITPSSFLRAISEGTDPSPADKAAIDRQIAQKQIRVYVYNSQNSTPDVSAQVKAAKAAGIPVVAVTETLSPRGATFQQWQTSQLTALQTALARGAAA